MGDHSSRRRIAPPLKQPTRATSWNEAHVPPLFGLAPGGVCLAIDVTANAVRSYRTLSTLPRRNTADCFLWHFPWGHPRRALPGTVVPWSPDFPPAFAEAKTGGRPTLWLSLCKMSALAVQEKTEE